MLAEVAAAVVGVAPTEADLAAAGRCVAHHVACAVAARDLPWCTAVEETIGDGTAATLLGSGRTTSVEDAVFGNAVLGQSTLAEDLHVPSLTHPGSVVVPVAMALAEQESLSGKDFLTAVVVGYEVLCRFGAALRTAEFTARGFRPSGVFGPLGAAAAAARLLGLDERRAAHAIAIAANTAAGLREWAHTGSTDVYVHNGLAARNGLLAARLAAAGITGPDSALTGPTGMAHAYAGTRTIGTPPFGGPPAIREVTFKRYPTCSAVQTVAQLAMAMYDRYAPTDIESVTVFTHRHGTTNPGCDHAGPFDDIGQAQMSNQLTVALALTGSRLTVSDYRTVPDLTRRVTVVEDPAYTARYPRYGGARLEIRLADGRLLADELLDGDPLTAEEVRSNLHDQVTAARGTATADAVLQQVDELVTLADVRTLPRLLRRSTG
jgi:2-methylcitrate dehydratase PrpD